MARRAGVSHQTVSRVLNGHPRVRDETRDRVLAVVSELGYRRNQAARALVTSRSGTIGVLTARSAHYGPVSTLIAVEVAARRAGLFVSVASLHDYDADSVTATLDHFLDQGADGIIVIAPVADAVASASALAAQVPMVLVAADVASEQGYATASIDQELGGRLATRHLIEQGHTDIAHLSGPTGWLDAGGRRRGWADELRRAGLASRPVLEGDWTAESGWRAGQRWVSGSPPAAVFAGNDQMALGLVAALTDAGLQVPNDVSVVGFDDIEGAGYQLPPLTTVRQDLAALGEVCVQLLLDALAGQPPRGLVVAPELVVRQSTARPGRRSTGSSTDSD